jgi:site-specific DNA recombinase
MRVALYIRVSTLEQAYEGYSLDNQKERLIAYTTSQGWNDTQIYMDDGYTGTDMNRPGLKRLIRHIEEKSIQAVIVLKLDRLSRKQKDALYLLEDVFDKNGVIFKSATEPIETSSPLGKAMIGVLAVFAQLERDMIVERTTSGRRQRVSSGMWYGGPIPYGYNWNKEIQMLEILPDEAHIIQEIYKQYMQGISRLAISEWVAERTKSRVFDHGVIRDMLSRPLYMGKLMNAGTLVDGRHESIIEEDDWYEVQKEVKRRKEGMSPIGDYLLTGLLKCGVCGHTIVHVRRTTKKLNRSYSYELYACKNQHVRKKDRNVTCSLGYSKRELVEAYVIDQMQDIALKPKLMSEIMSREHDDHLKNDVIETLEDKLMNVTSGLENLYDAIQKGEIKHGFVGSRIKNLEEEREAIEKQLEDMKDIAPKMKEPDQVYYLIKEIGEAWEYFSFEEQKIMIRKIIRRVILHKNADPEVIWNITE